MKRLHVLRILSVLLLVAMSLSAANPAYADTHYQEVIPVDDYWVWQGNDIDNPCGFDLAFWVDGYIRANYWLDENGELTHVINIFGNIKANVSAHGKKVVVRSQGPENWVYSEDKVKVVTTGPTEFITVPGYGIVFGTAGHWVETWTIDPDTGEWNNYSSEFSGNFQGYDWDPICEYLGP